MWLNRYPTAEHVRATACNYWHKGVDGLYAFFAQWPHGDVERAWLGELAHPDLMLGKTKRYHLSSRPEDGADNAYHATMLPLDLPPGVEQSIQFFIADDLQGEAGFRARSVTLTLTVGDLVGADNLALTLNGHSLAEMPCSRDFGNAFGPYASQRLELTLLGDARPQRGINVLGVQVAGRPADLTGMVVVKEMEVEVVFSSNFGSRL